MCNPQPRGLRQAPLIPSGFFTLDLANQPSGGGRRRCPARKSRSLSGNSETGGFHGHTHNEGLLLVRGEFKPYGGITVT